MLYNLFNVKGYFPQVKLLGFMSFMQQLQDSVLPASCRHCIAWGKKCYSVFAIIYFAIYDKVLQYFQ